MWGAVQYPVFDVGCSKMPNPLTAVATLNKGWTPHRKPGSYMMLPPRAQYNYTRRLNFNYTLRLNSERVWSDMKYNSWEKGKTNVTNS